MATLHARSETAEAGPLESLLTAKGLTLRTVLAAVMSSVALALGMLSVFVGYFIPPSTTMFLSTVLALALVLTFLTFPLCRRRWSDPPGWPFAVDLLLIALAIACRVYIGLDVEAFEARWGVPSDLDVLVGTVEILLVLEATRRAVSPVLVIVVGVFLVYPLVADQMPGFLVGPPAEWRFLVSLLFMQSHGLFGLPLDVIASYVTLFIIFGAILGRSGAGAFFINLALAATGWQTGGPAKAAVISSALFGSLSGSAIANVVTTGTFTIPLMKRIGYPPHFAAAVEATASTGGMIMPPVMGAVGFIMAAFMGVAYGEVALAATVPALLYYASLFWQVHFEAKQLGLVRVPAHQLPELRRVLAQGWHLALPLIAVIAMILMGRSVSQMGFAALAVAIAVTFWKKETRLSPTNLLLALEDGVRAAVPVMVTTAAVGLIIGSIYATGAHFQIATLVLQVSGGQLWLALLLTMAVLLFLGMGMGIVAEYLAVAALIVPGLIQLGVVPMAAHMFAVYYAVIGAVTPPVSIASYAAAGLADAPPFRTAWLACRLALAGFIVPWMFVFSPQLLFRGPWQEVALAFISANIGIVALAASLEGYLLRPANAVERALLLVTALLLIKPGLETDLVGLGLLGIVLVAQRLWPAGLGRRRPAPPTAPVSAAAAVPAQAAPHEGRRGLVIAAAAAPPTRPTVAWLQWVALIALLAILGWAGTASLHLRDMNIFLDLLLALGLGLVALLRLGVAARETAPEPAPSAA